MTRVFISVGSNIEREKHVRLGCEALASLGVSLRFSTLYEAESVGYQGANYFNFIVEMETSLSLDRLLGALKAIEQRYEPEVQQQGYRQRCLDLDVILYGQETSVSPYPLPRNDLFKFAFVLLPMSELAPELLVPGHSKTLLELWQSLSLQPPMQTQSLQAVDWDFYNNKEK
ncbi:2-amino-4-hydroxy-6-hydroxymethyldihydropteridine diphosphokinase [Thaumasiovibrio subtropicus]|uniref:2-amino-4-hydroxy-6- hydroxymethyldihydropteridine diphosphokinase n=1 Tax=Thaumasiovibrio subtropicus TaxID=1891207 RepID=UPI000B350587|nr:2-amino-4-hydroxy-6-hydroxymethyldihydropteridine diphosphokinase [Thaumasiovibrio subtropicus]